MQEIYHSHIQLLLFIVNPFFFSFTWYLLSVVVVFHCAFLRDRSICYVLKLKALYHFELDLIL